MVIVSLKKREIKLLVDWLKVYKDKATGLELILIDPLLAKLTAYAIAEGLIQQKVAKRGRRRQ